MAPPELMDELVEDVVLRFPPDDPARLVRAALVCKRWRRVISDPDFRRRFLELHRSVTPMLGFFCNVTDIEGVDVARFVPTSSFRPRRGTERRSWRAIDCRHGRVLLLSIVMRNYQWENTLVVWDPIEDEHRELPKLTGVYCPSKRRLNAAVLCAAGGGCDHVDCRRGPFVVVFVGTFGPDHSVCVYSSEAGAWSRLMTRSSSTYDHIELASSVLVGNALYFLIQQGMIKKYDLGAHRMSTLYTPRQCYKHALLMTTEDGGLGHAILHNSKIYIWWMFLDTTGEEGWGLSRVIDLEALLPVGTSLKSHDVVGFEYTAGVIFVATTDGMFTIDLNSGHVKNVGEASGYQHVIPYMSFYTPGAALLTHV